MKKSRKTWLAVALALMLALVCAFAVGCKDKDKPGNTTEIAFDAETTFYMDLVAFNFDGFGVEEMKYTFKTDGTFSRNSQFDSTNTFAPAFKAVLPDYTGTYGLNEAKTKITFHEPEAIEEMTYSGPADDEPTADHEYDLVTLEDNSFYFEKTHDASGNTQQFKYYSNPEMFASQQPFEYPEALGTKVLFDAVTNYVGDNAILGRTTITFDADDGIYTLSASGMTLEKGAYNLVKNGETLTQIKLMEEDNTEASDIVTCDVTVSGTGDNAYNTFVYMDTTFYSDVSKLFTYPAEKLGTLVPMASKVTFADKAESAMLTITLNTNGQYTGKLVIIAGVIEGDLSGAYNLVYEDETLIKIKLLADPTNDEPDPTVAEHTIEVKTEGNDTYYVLSYKSGTDTITLYSDTSKIPAPAPFVYPTETLGEKNALMGLLPTTITFTNGMGVWTYKFNNDGSFSAECPMAAALNFSGAWNFVFKENSLSEYVITYVKTGDTATATATMIKTTEGEAPNSTDYYELQIPEANGGSTSYYSDPSKIPVAPQE